MPNLDTLSITFKPNINGTIGKNVTGTAYQSISPSVSLTKTGLTFLRTVANNAALGADEIVSFIATIAPSGTTTISLASLTDMVLQSGVSLARVKGYRIQLLSTTDDVVNGTICSSISVGNATANPFPFNHNVGTVVDTLNNGEYMEWATPGAAGIVVGANSNIKIGNNDSVNATAAQVTLLGGTT